MLGSTKFFPNLMYSNPRMNLLEKTAKRTQQLNRLAHGETD